MITIIDYRLGNIASVANALMQLEVPYQISGDIQMIRRAKGLILPGVGAAGQGMENLKKSGLDKVITEEVRKGKPFLGICLGMQLLFEKSEEGNVNCLGIFKGMVKKFRKEKKIPQIGWNQVEIRNKALEIMENIEDNSSFYFVNSFYCVPKDNSLIAGESVYGEKFASIVAKENVIGFQFHPEKSGTVGFTLLNNFIKNYVN